MTKAGYKLPIVRRKGALPPFFYLVRFLANNDVTKHEEIYNSNHFESFCYYELRVYEMEKANKSNGKK